MTVAALSWDSWLSIGLSIAAFVFAFASTLLAVRADRRADRAEQRSVRSEHREEERLERERLEAEAADRARLILWRKARPAPSTTAASPSRSATMARQPRTTSESGSPTKTARTCRFTLSRRSHSPPTNQPTSTACQCRSTLTRKTSVSFTHGSTAAASTRGRHTFRPRSDTSSARAAPGTPYFLRACIRIRQFHNDEATSCVAGTSWKIRPLASRRVAR
jgi:hypothetical protein